MFFRHQSSPFPGFSLFMFRSLLIIAESHVSFSLGSLHNTHLSKSRSSVPALCCHRTKYFSYQQSSSHFVYTFVLVGIYYWTSLLEDQKNRHCAWHIVSHLKKEVKKCMDRTEEKSSTTAYPYSVKLLFIPSKAARMKTIVQKLSIYFWKINKCRMYKMNLRRCLSLQT